MTRLQTIPIREVAVTDTQDELEDQQYLTHCGQALRNRRELLRSQSLEQGRQGEWTLEDVARRLRVSFGTIADLERGKQWTRVPTLRRYAKLLGLDLGLLFRVDPTSKHAELLRLLAGADPDLEDILLSLLKLRHPYRTCLTTHQCENSG